MVSKYVPAAVGGAAGFVGGLGALGRFIIPPFFRGALDTLGTKTLVSSCANLHRNPIQAQERA
jgi:nitrate/nitrite transporter NarK